VIKIGPLTLSPSQSLASSFSEMADALEAMESGDYDHAYSILEAVVRPADPLAVDDLIEPFNSDLLTRRIFRDIVTSAPAGLYVQRHSGFIATTAALLAAATRNPDKLDDREWLIALLSVASRCGLDFEPSNTNEAGMYE